MAQLRRARRGHGLRGHAGRRRSSGATCPRTTSCSWSIRSSASIRRGSAAFVQAGGNVVIADDFGEGKDAMAGLGLLRAERRRTPHASRYYDGPRCGRRSRRARGDHPIATRRRRGRHEPPGGARRTSRARPTVVGFDDGARRRRRRARHRPVRRGQRSEHLHQPHAASSPATSSSPTNILRWLDRATAARATSCCCAATCRCTAIRGRSSTIRTAARSAARSPSSTRWLSSRARVAAHADRDEGARRRRSPRACSLLALARAAGAPRPADRRRVAAVRAARRGATSRTRSVAARPTTERRRELLVLALHPARSGAGLARATRSGRAEPLYTVPEAELVAQLSRPRRAPIAGVALARVYRRLRALPSRGQAAAPWSARQLARRDFDSLYEDVAELCRTLGRELAEAEALVILTCKPLSPTTSSSRVSQLARAITDEVGRAFIGAPAITEALLTALLARGHVLIEGYPGRREDHAGQGVLGHARLPLPPHPVHARSPAVATSPARTSSTCARTRSCCARARCSRTSCSATRSTARPRRRSRRCSRRCRSSRSRSRARRARSPSRSSCSRRRTRSSRRAPTRCPRRRSIAS